MTNLFKQNSYKAGTIIAIGCLVAGLALVWVGLTSVQQPVGTNIKWFGLAFIPMVLLLHRYAKIKEQPKVTKAIIVVLFISFIAYMALMHHTKALELQ